MPTKKKQSTSNQITEMKITELHPFKNHPFKVLDVKQERRAISLIRKVRCARIYNTITVRAVHSSLPLKKVR